MSIAKILTWVFVAFTLFAIGAVFWLVASPTRDLAVFVSIWGGLWASFLPIFLATRRRRQQSDDDRQRVQLASRLLYRRRYPPQRTIE